MISILYPGWLLSPQFNRNRRVWPKVHPVAQKPPIDLFVAGLLIVPTKSIVRTGTTIPAEPTDVCGLG